LIFFTVFFNLSNGKYFTLDNIKLDDRNCIIEMQKKTNFFENPIIFKLGSELLPVITLTINLSNKCNLMCSYCFRDFAKNNDNDITYESCIKYIELMLGRYPSSKYFHIDLTGDAEPLLNFDLIKKLVEYTKSHSTHERTLDIGFCTNGTLLTKNITDYLETNNIYYGISIDGDKKLNDYYRKFHNNQSVYDSVMKNIKYGQSKYRGAAVTITNRSKNFTSFFKLLNKKFDVITMKPVRQNQVEYGEINNNNNVQNILEEYTKLYNFIMKETLKGNVWYLLAIIQDEDLFGKFIRRVILNQSAIVRCGGGINKFALGKNDEIYICGAAEGIEGLKIGNINQKFDHVRIDKLIDIQMERKKCFNCWAKFICGGPCLVNSVIKFKNYTTADDTICIINKHLIKLAFMFREHLSRKRNNLYHRVFELCMDNHYK
jgi:uncharacterized protein